MMGFLSERMGRTALTLQKNAPNILFGVGIASSVTSTVLACRATLKLDEALEEGQKQMARVKAADPDILENYSHMDQKRDITLIYVQTGIEVVKLYLPAIGFGILAVGSLTKSHDLLTKRNAAITAAYAAVDQAFKEYRARVVDRYGEQVDQEMRYGVEKVEIVDETTGRKKTVKRAAPGEPSMYAKFFDEYSRQWSKDPESNFIFLRCQQTYFNDLLIIRGHVFLNEVYDRLGLPHTQAGSVVGWMMGNDDEPHDNFIDFGIFNRSDQTIRDFMNGREASILLDFNVDGVIYDKIDTPRAPLSWQEG